MSEFDASLGNFSSQLKAHEQVEEYGHSFECEMGFWQYMAFLHINGYDHYTRKKKRRCSFTRRNFNSLWTHKTINENGKSDLVSSLEFAQEFDCHQGRT